MRVRDAFTLVELLVVIAIIAILAAILFPVFGHAREKARQSTCMSNQHELALLLIQYAQDHGGAFPKADRAWQDLQPSSGLVTCQTIGKRMKNAYVINSAVTGEQMDSFPVPTETALTIDGIHRSADLNNSYDNIAYSWRDLDKRHGGKFVVSYLDAHVELTNQIPWLFKMPKWPDLEIWFASDWGVNMEPHPSVIKWLDRSQFHLNATPTSKNHFPEYFPSVPSLGDAPAVFFRPPNNNPNMLVTDNISQAWDTGHEEATMFIVFQPTGNNDNFEYSIFDQDNGDPLQATRVRQGGQGGKYSAATQVFSAGGNGNGNGGGPPTVSLSASPSTLVGSGQVTLTWSSSGATAVVSSNFGAGPGSPLSGSQTVTVNSTTTYTITLTNNGKQKSASATVTVAQPPPTVTLAANPTTITDGDDSTLSWSATNATSVVSSNFQSTSVSGSQTVSPTSNTTYTITVSGPGGQATATQTVTVNQGTVSVSLSANKTTITSGESVTLSWSSSGATQVVNNGTNFDASGVNGTASVSPTVTTTYTITVKKKNQEASDSVTITVIAKAPTVTLTADPSTIKSGGQVSLNWDSTDATTVVSSNFNASGASGSKKQKTDATTTYTITVSGPGGQATSSVLVTVTTDTGNGGGSGTPAGRISWFRKDAAVQYPPEAPWNTPTLWTLVAASDRYQVYNKGVPYPPYSGGPNWLTPTFFTIGGSSHGFTANQRSFDGYIGEIIIFRRVLSDSDRQKVEQYLMAKFGLK